MVNEKPMNRVSTAEMKVKSILNLQYTYSQMLIMLMRMTSDVVVGTDAREAALKTAESMISEACEVYDCLVETYK